MTIKYKIKNYIKSIISAIKRRLYRYLITKQSCKFNRYDVHSCWCGGDIQSIKWHKNYGKCKTCGCYINMHPPLHEELKKIYSFDYYWHKRQKYKGSPEIEFRQNNDINDGRVFYWLNLIKKYCPQKGQVIEIGCAHGVLLRELKQLGYKCIGVEPDEKTAQWTTKETGVTVLAGIFPNIDLPMCDIFLAFDVIEHSSNPLLFLEKASNLLLPNGVIIIQTPIDRYDFSPPFGDCFENAFDDLEHLYLFTNNAFIEMADRCGLEILEMQERLWLHHEICVLRKL